MENMKYDLIKYLYDSLENLKLQYMIYVLHINSDTMYKDFEYRINKSEYNLYMWINNKFFNLYF